MDFLRSSSASSVALRVPQKLVDGLLTSTTGSTVSPSRSVAASRAATQRILLRSRSPLLGSSYSTTKQSVIQKLAGNISVSDVPFVDEPSSPHNATYSMQTLAHRRIDMGIQVSLPALFPYTDGYIDYGNSGPRVLLHNVDTPTVSRISLCLPTVTVSSTNTTVTLSGESTEAIEPEITVQYLVGVLKAVDLRLHRAHVRVPLVARSDCAANMPDQLIANIADASIDLLFYKVRSQSLSAVTHVEDYYVPLSRVFLMHREYVFEKGFDKELADNPFLMPTAANEELFAITNPFTDEKMELTKNPLLDPTSRASQQPIEALVQTFMTRFHGINNASSPYHNRNLLQSSQLISAQGSRAVTPSVSSRAASSNMSINCAQDPSMGALMDDFVQQRGMIEQRMRRHLRLPVKQAKDTRARSLPQKLNSVPILVGDSISYEASTSASEKIDLEPPNALANDFIKTVIPAPAESFYTFFAPYMSRNDPAYDITMDVGYFQHSVFFGVLRSIEKLAHEFSISAERLQQLQLDYLQEYKLHLTAVHNRYAARIQTPELPATPITTSEYAVMSTAERSRIHHIHCILSLVRPAPIGATVCYANSILSRFQAMLDSTDSLSSLRSLILERFPLSYKTVDGLRVAQKRLLDSIAATRRCITWNTLYRSTILPAIRDICRETDTLVQQFYNRSYSAFSQTVRTTLDNLQDELSTLSSAYTDCVLDCDSNTDIFRGKLADIRPEEWGALTTVLDTCSASLQHIIAGSHEKVLSKIRVVYDLIFKILSRDVNVLHCIKALFFLYWRTVTPFRMLITSGQLYYKIISYLINLEFQIRKYTEARQSRGDCASVPIQIPLDYGLSYDEYVDVCIKEQYMFFRGQFTASDCFTAHYEGTDFARDAFGIVAAQDYPKIRYNASHIGIRKPLRIVLGCTLQPLGDIFLSMARQLSVAMYPILRDFVQLFDSKIVSIAELPEPRHSLERRNARNLKKYRKALRAQIAEDSKHILEVSFSSDSSDSSSDGEAHPHANPQDHPGGHDRLKDTAANAILGRLHHFGFVSSDLHFANRCYGVILNLTIQTPQYAPYRTNHTAALRNTSSYRYYMQSVEQLSSSVSQLRDHRSRVQLERAETLRIALDKDSKQLAKHKLLAFEDLGATASLSYTELYASLATLDVAYSEKLKNIKLPLDHELRKTVREMNDISKILTEEDFRVTRNSVDTLPESQEQLVLDASTQGDDLDSLCEWPRLVDKPIVIDKQAYSKGAIIAYMHPVSVKDIVRPGAFREKLASVYITYSPEVERSLIPLWNMALDLCTLFFTLPIMVSFSFDYFFPTWLNLGSVVPHTTVSTEQTSSLCLTLIDFYVPASRLQNDTSSETISRAPSALSTGHRRHRQSLKSILTDRQMLAVEEFWRQGVFPPDQLDGELAEFVHSWNAIHDSCSSMLRTQKQLALPVSLRFSETILDNTRLQQIYADLSPLSMLTGSVVSKSGYSSFLNIADYNMIDYRLINSKFECVTSTTHLVLDTISSELGLDRVCNVIQVALNAAPMRAVYMYLAKYAQHIGAITLYDSGTVLCAELGGNHMWRLDADTVAYGAKMGLKALLELLSSADVPTPPSDGTYSILSPKFHEVIPLLDLDAIDDVLEYLSTYNNAFQTFPHILYKSVFCISFQAFKKNISSIIAYYRYLYMYVQYSACLFVIKTCEHELEHLNASLARPIGSPSSALEQKELLTRLSAINLSRLYSHVYTVCITQYDALCIRFPDLRAVFDVGVLEMAAFSVLQRTLGLQDAKRAAEKSISQSIRCFKELVVHGDEWISNVSTTLVDRLKLLSCLTYADIEDMESNPVAFKETYPTLTKPVTFPPIIKESMCEDTDIVEAAVQVFIGSICSTTTMPVHPDATIPSEPASMDSDSVLAQCRPVLGMCACKRGKNVVPVPLSAILSELYYISSELVAIDAVIGSWRSALFSQQELTSHNVLFDTAPSLRQIDLCVKTLYTMVVYSEQLGNFFVAARDMRYSGLRCYVSELHEIFKSVLNAAGLFSTWIYPACENTEALVGLDLSLLSGDNTFCGEFLARWNTSKAVMSSETLQLLTKRTLTIATRGGAHPPELSFSNWSKYMSVLKAKLQQLAMKLVCIDMLTSPILTPAHRDIINGYFKISDIYFLSDALNAVLSDPCGPEFLAYTYINAHIDYRAMKKISEIDAVINKIVFSPPVPFQRTEVADNKKQCSQENGVHILLAPAFTCEDVPLALHHCENVLGGVLTQQRKFQPEPSEPRTIMHVYLAHIQQSACVPIHLLPHAHHIVQPTYSAAVHQRIKSLRLSINQSASFYFHLLRIPRLLSYALAMYRHASLLEVTVARTSVKLKLGQSKMLCSTSSLSMHEATVLTNIHDQYTSLIKIKLTEGTPLSLHAVDQNLSRIIISLHRDLESIVHRLITVPFLHLFSKLSTDNAHYRHQGHATGKRDASFSPTVSFGEQGRLHLKRIVPYINGVHHFMGVLFPPWFLPAHASLLELRELLATGSCVWSATLCGITDFSVAVSPLGKQHITALISHTDTLQLLDPVECPNHAYSLPNMLHSVVGLALSAHCLEIFEQLKKATSVLASVPFAYLYDVVVSPNSSLSATEKDIEAHSLLNVCNQVIDIMNNAVYDGICAATSMLLGTLLETQLESMTPAAFLETYASEQPILFHCYNVLLILLFAIKMGGEGGSTQVATAHHVTHGPSNDSNHYLRHNSTYQKTLRIWITEQYMLLLTLEHDLYSELQREKKRDKVAINYVVNAIAYDRNLAHTHAAHLSENRAFSFFGKTVKEYLHCLSYPIPVWKTRHAVPTSMSSKTLYLSLSNNMAVLSTTTHWLGAPQPLEAGIIFLPHMYTAMIRLVLSLEDVVYTFAMLDRDRCGSWDGTELRFSDLPEVILGKLRRLTLRSTAMVQITAATFDSAVLDIMRALASGLIVGLIGYDLLSTKHQVQLIHMLESLSHLASKVPGLAMMDTVSQQACDILKASSIGEQWSTMTIDDQLDMVRAHVFLRDVTVDDVLSQPHGMGRLIVFVSGLQPTAQNTTPFAQQQEVTHASDSQEDMSPLVEQVATPLNLSKEASDILNGMLSPHVVNFSLHGGRSTMQHRALTPARRLIDDAWVSCFVYKSSLSQATICLAQLDLVHLSVSDEEVILSRCAAQTPLCTAMSLLSYLLTAICTVDVAPEERQAVLSLIEKVISTTLLTTATDAKYLSEAVKAYLSVCVTFDERAFYKYIVRYFYIHFAKSYRDRLSMLMLGTHQSFILSYAATLITNLFAADSRPLLLSCSSDSASELVQLVCTMHTWGCERVVSCDELERLVACWNGRRQEAPNTLVFYMAPSIGEVQAAYHVILSLSSALRLIAFVTVPDYLSNKVELCKVFSKRIVLPSAFHSAPRGVELLLSPILSELQPSNDMLQAVLGYQRYSDTSAPTLSIRLDMPPYGIDLEDSVKALVNGSHPPFLRPLASLSHVVSCHIDESFVNALMSLLPRLRACYRLACLQRIFPLTFQGIVATVHKGIISVLPSSIFTAVPQKLVASLIWQQLIHLRLVKYDSVFPRQAASCLHRKRHNHTSIRVTQFGLSSTSYEGYYLGDLAVAGRLQDSRDVSKYDHFLQFHSINDGPIPSQSEIFLNAVHCLEGIQKHDQWTTALSFCSNTVTALFVDPESAAEGCIRLMLFIFFAVWNAYSLLALVMQDHGKGGKTVAELNSSLCLCLKRLLWSLFNVETDVTGFDKPHLSCGYLLTAFKVVVALDTWETFTRVGVSNNSYSEVDYYMKLCDHVHKLLHAGSGDFMSILSKNLHLTSAVCRETLAAALPAFHEVLSRVLREVEEHMTGVPDEFIPQVMPAVSKAGVGAGAGGMQFKIAQYKQGEGLLSGLTHIPQHHSMDTMIVEGAFLFALQKHQIYAQYQKLYMESSGKDPYVREEIVKSMRAALTSNLLAYSYGLGSAYQSSIQQPFRPCVLIDTSRAGLILITAACILSAILYPSGVPLLIAGDRNTGKTTIFDIAKQLVCSSTGFKTLVAGKNVAKDLTNIFRLSSDGMASWMAPSEAYTVSSWIFHIHDARCVNLNDTLLVNLTRSVASMQPDLWPRGSAHHCIGDISLHKAGVIVELTDAVERIVARCLGAASISVPKVTSHHIYSVLNTFYAGHEVVCSDTLLTILQMLSTKCPALFADFRFASDLQHHIALLPPLGESAFLCAEPDATQDRRVHRTVYAIVSALRSVPGMDNAQLADIFTHLSAHLNEHWINEDVLKASAAWHVEAAQIYSCAARKKPVSIAGKALQKMVAQTIEKLTLKSSFCVSSFASVSDLGSVQRTEQSELERLFSTYYTNKVTNPDLAGSPGTLLFCSAAEQIKTSALSTKGSASMESSYISLDALDSAVPDVACAFGHLSINADWFQQFVVYLEAAITDTYLEHIVYNRQLSEAKARLLIPPSSPKYISTIMAIDIFLKFTAVKIEKECHEKVLSCVPGIDAMLPGLHLFTLATNPYAALRMLALNQTLTQLKGFSGGLFNPKSHNTAHIALRKIHELSNKHFLFDMLCNDKLEEDVHHMLQLQLSVYGSPCAQSTELKPVQSGALPCDPLSTTLDLRLSDLRNSTQIGVNTLKLNIIDTQSIGRNLSAVIPHSIAHIPIVPVNLCHRLVVHSCGSAELQQVTYLIHLLGSYTPFLEMDFGYLFNDYGGTDGSLQQQTEHYVLTARGNKTKDHPQEEEHKPRHRRVLFDMDALLLAVASILKKEKKANHRDATEGAESLLKHLSIATLEITTHSQIYEPDFIATLMLLRTAICLAVGINPVSLLYKVNHGSFHSSTQFGHLTALSQRLLHTSNTVLFESNVTAGLAILQGYSAEPLFNSRNLSSYTATRNIETRNAGTRVSEDGVSAPTIVELQSSVQRADDNRELTDQEKDFLHRNIIEPAYVAIVVTNELITREYKNSQRLGDLLCTTLGTGAFLDGLFTADELAILLMVLSINAGSPVLLGPRDLGKVLSSLLDMYIVEESSEHRERCSNQSTNTTSISTIGGPAALSVTDLLSGVVQSFFGSMQLSASTETEWTLPPVPTFTHNPLSVIPSYTVEQLQIECKINRCEPPRYVNLPKQLGINWGRSSTTMLLVCLSLHRACSRLSPRWQVPLQSYIKLVSDTIGLIFSRTQQYYANVNSINNVFKAYNVLVQEVPAQEPKTHDGLYSEIYDTYFSSNKAAVLPIESVSMRYLQYFLRNVVTQEDKVAGELCYMRNALCSVLEACKEYSKVLAVLIRNVYYEVPILIAYVLFGLTGVLNATCTPDQDTTHIFELLAQALQADGLPVLLPGAVPASTSSATRQIRLFPTWGLFDLQCRSFFYHHLHVSLCLDTPMFLAETVYHDIMFVNEEAQSFLRAGLLFGLVGRRIFLTYSDLVHPLAFVQIAGNRKFDTPFYSLHDTLQAASTAPDPLKHIYDKNRMLGEYIHQTRQRVTELSIQQPHKTFCTSLTKTLAESDKVIIFTDIGEPPAHPENYSLLRKLFLLAATVHIEARQQLTFGSQNTYLFQPLANYIFILSLSPRYNMGVSTQPVIDALLTPSVREIARLDNVTFLCRASSPTEIASRRLAKQCAITTALTRAVFGPEFDQNSAFCRRNSLLSQFSHGMTRLVNGLHEHILAQGLAIFPFEGSAHNNVKIMTVDAYNQRRSNIETVLVKFVETTDRKRPCYADLTFSAGVFPEAAQSVTFILDLLREVSLILYMVVPGTDRRMTLADVHIRRMYAIGDDVSHFSLAQVANILNDLQLNRLIRSYWHPQIVALAKIALDVLLYIRSLIDDDPSLLIATGRASWITFSVQLRQDAVEHMTTGIHATLKRLVAAKTNKSTTAGGSVEEDRGSTDASATQDSSARGGQSQPKRTTIIADLILFSYNSLRYPIFYYALLRPVELRNYLLQRILSYALQHLKAAPWLTGARMHSLFISIYALSMAGMLQKEAFWSDTDAVPIEDLDTAILEDKFHLVPKELPQWKGLDAGLQNMRLLSHLFRPFFDETLCLGACCLVSAYQSDHSEEYTCLSEAGPASYIPAAFSVSQETKRLFIACVTLTRLSTGSIDLLSCFYNNGSAIILCSQYPCVIVTLVALYLADSEARRALEDMLNACSGAHGTHMGCSTLDALIACVIDHKLKKNLGYLDLGHMPGSLQAPSAWSLFVALLLSILLAPETIDTAVRVFCQALGAFCMPDEGDKDQRQGTACVRLVEQYSQPARIPMFLSEMDKDEAFTGLSHATSLCSSALCLCDSFIPILQATNAMAEATLFLAAKKCEADGVELQSESSYPQGDKDQPAGSHIISGVRNIRVYCRNHFPLTIIFYDRSSLSVDSLLALISRHYTSRVRYSSSVNMAPVVYRRPSSWTDFHLYSLVYALVQPTSFTTELKEFLHLILTRWHRNVEGQPAFPTWLIVPRDTLRQAIAISDIWPTDPIQLLEQLIYMVRPIIICITAGQLPSALCREMLTHSLLKYDAGANITEDEYNVALTTMLHYACMSPSSHHSTSYVTEFHQVFRLSSRTALQHLTGHALHLQANLYFIRAMNILNFIHSQHYGYTGNHRYRESFQSQLDYYIALKIASIRESLPLFGTRPRHRARLVNTNEAFLSAPGSSRLMKSATVPYAGAVADEPCFHVQSSMCIPILSAIKKTTPQLSENAASHLLHTVASVMAVHRVSEAQVVATVALDIPTRQTAANETPPAGAQALISTLSELLDKESKLHLKYLSEFPAFRSIIGDRAGVVREILTRRLGLDMRSSLLGSNSTDDELVLLFTQCTRQSIPYQVSFLSRVLRALSAPDAPDFVWSVSSKLGGALLQKLLVVFRITAAIRLGVSASKTSLLAFINLSSLQPCIDKAGLVSFTKKCITADQAPPSQCQPVLQLSDMVFWGGAYDPVLRSVVSVSAEQEQGYLTDTSVSFIVVALQRHELKLSASVVSVPVCVDDIFLSWLVLPQTQAVSLSPSETCSIAIIGRNNARQRVLVYTT